MLKSRGIPGETSIRRSTGSPYTGKERRERAGESERERERPFVMRIVTRLPQPDANEFADPARTNAGAALLCAREKLNRP